MRFVLVKLRTGDQHTALNRQCLNCHDELKDHRGGWSSQNGQMWICARSFLCLSPNTPGFHGYFHGRNVPEAHRHGSLLLFPGRLEHLWWIHRLPQFNGAESGECGRAFCAAIFPIGIHLPVPYECYLPYLKKRSVPLKLLLFCFWGGQWVELYHFLGVFFLGSAVMLYEIWCSEGWLGGVLVQSTWYGCCLTSLEHLSFSVVPWDNLTSQIC